MTSRGAAFDAVMIATRRRLVLGAIGVLTTACVRVPSIASPSVADLENRIGGRVGVFAVDTGSGRALAHRADERFAMCSTFKWLLAASALARVDRGEVSLDDRVSYAAGDLLEHAPVTRAHVNEGAMTIGALAEAAVTVSDNTAANLLLAKTGGPGGLTTFARSLGDGVTRLDRDEPGLNENAPGDPRDTTSPRAMVGLLRKALLGDALSATSRERLAAWLRACDTGKDRLRRGMPADWIAGDKTGSGRRGAVNDVAIAWPPARAAIVVAAYLSGSRADLPTLVAAHAEIGRLVARELSGS